MPHGSQSERLSCGSPIRTDEVTCIELRLQLMFTCFNGGDQPHWNQVDQRLRGLFRCICLMDINGCPPAFRFP